MEKSMLQFERKNHAFSFQTTQLSLKNWLVRIQVNDLQLELKDARVETDHANTWQLFFDELQLQLTIIQKLKNRLKFHSLKWKHGKKSQRCVLTVYPRVNV